MSAPIPFSLLRATPAQRRTLVAAALGWMLDAFDVMLYALVLTHIMRDLGMSKPIGGLLGTFTLLASGIGGVLFGYVADRIGRTRALMLSILTYSICSFASGLATSIAVLAVVRFILGLGMGGEWNTGATLVAETWPTELRARAIAVVQSSWAVGYAFAALVAWAVLRWTNNWRMVFFVGVLPALVTLWIRSDVPESEMWRERQSAAQNSAPTITFGELFTGRWAKPTFALLFMNFFGMFGWWGLFTWIPTFLSAPPSEGGRGLSSTQMTLLLVIINLAGMFPGYATFGWMADWLGRRRAVILYTLAAAALVPLYATVTSPLMLVVFGSPLAFFGTGFFSGSGIMGSEIFPTSVRARALGFTYNGARTLSAVATYAIGLAASRVGLARAFLLCGVAYFLSSLAATQIPETRGKQLE